MSKIIPDEETMEIIRSVFPSKIIEIKDNNEIFKIRKNLGQEELNASKKRGEGQHTK